MGSLEGNGKPENVLAERIIGAAIEVHRHLGPGLLESVYQECLARELLRGALDVRREVALPVRYKGEAIGQVLRLDLLVNELVIVEVKSVSELLPMFALQLHTYLKLADKKLGLLLNFNVPVMKDGIKRVVNRL